MKRIFLIATLTSCITMLSVTAACAQSEVKEREKRESKVLISNASTGGSGDGTITKFDVPKDRGMIKVHVHNQGKHTMVVTVDRGSEVKMSHHVAAGERWTGYSNSSFSTGSHSVQVYSPDGDSKGKVSVRGGSSRSSL